MFLPQPSGYRDIFYPRLLGRRFQEWMEKEASCLGPRTGTECSRIRVPPPTYLDCKSQRNSSSKDPLLKRSMSSVGTISGERGREEYDHPILSVVTKFLMKARKWGKGAYFGSLFDGTVYGDREGMAAGACGSGHIASSQEAERDRWLTGQLAFSSSVTPRAQPGLGRRRVFPTSVNLR